MAYKQETRDAVRRSYIFDRLPLEKAAAANDVGYQTARTWKRKAKDNGDDWDKVRTAHTMAGGETEDIARGLLTDLLIEYRATMDLIKEATDMGAMQRVEILTSLSDSYNKALSASKKLLPETSKLATALEVLEMQIDYIKKHHNKHLVVFVEILEGFGDVLERELK
ncbi:MAG: DUF1804 family protein [Gammaproteobacteria bacterium]|nr:DUF1804 family protein [Gammaproteobacteria bacterium]